MAAGAIGNMIDRVLKHYVVDFIYFELINFPIFNVADCYVTISAALLIISIMFIYKEEDFKFISKSSAHTLGENNDKE
jgi:signal peptidase II